jgi:hypothetical protein
LVDRASERLGGGFPGHAAGTGATGWMRAEAAGDVGVLGSFAWIT